MKNILIILMTGIIFLLLFGIFPVSAQNPEWINHNSKDYINSLSTNREWVVYDTSNSDLPSNSIFSIAIHENDIKWIGTSEGLVRFDGTIWTVFNTENSGLPSNGIYSITTDKAGMMWIATWEGLVRFDGENWIVYNTANSGLPSNYIVTIATDQSGNAWIGTLNHGLVSFDGANWTVYNTGNSGLESNNIQDIVIDSDGIIWIGTVEGQWYRYSAGLTRFDGVTWTGYKPDNSGIPDYNIRAIRIDEARNKWIGTYNHGLVRFDEETCTIYNTLNSDIPANFVRSISIDRNGNKWMGIDKHGLTRFDSSTWTVYNTDNSGLPSNIVTEIAIDTNGYKWIGTNGGLAVYNEGGVVIPQIYTISGEVTKDGAGLENVTVTASGGHSQTATTNSNGEYTITGVPGGTTVTITPNRPGYTFNPPSRQVTDISHNVTDIDFIATALNGSGTVADIDGNVYQTVLIGNQWWMTEDLRVSRYRDGSAIPTGLDNIAWQNATSGAYAIYPHSQVDGINSDQEMIIAYGKLYNWHAVGDTRGLCPAGWDIPGDDDWKELEMYLGMAEQVANETGWRGTGEGGKLKSTRTEPDAHPRWNVPNKGSTNSSGFSGMPGGNRYLQGLFSYIGDGGTWWSSTNAGAGTAWFRSLNYNDDNILRGDYNKVRGFSVRCLKDRTLLPSIRPTGNPQQVAGIPFWVEIEAGNPNTVTDLYGISLHLKSDNPICTYIDGSAEAGTFLGGSPVFFSQKVDEQTVDIAVTKTSPPGGNGSGIIARAQFTTSPMLDADTEVNFSVENITAVDSDGAPIAFDPSTFSVTVVTGIIVWPGDTNNDGKVDGADLLPIGLYYGQTISEQNNPGIQWQGYSRSAWATDGETPRRVYADANGDGTITAADVLAIGLNYGKTHTVSAPAVYAGKPEETTEPDGRLNLTHTDREGNDLTLRIAVESLSPVYGISFKLMFDDAIASHTIDVSDGVLGTDILTFSRYVAEGGYIDVGMSLKEGSGYTGEGELLQLTVRREGAGAVEITIDDIVAVDENGTPLLFTGGSITGLTDGGWSSHIPVEYSLRQNYPNPFNPLTVIEYGIPSESYVVVVVYDMLGREVSRLADDVRSAGVYRVTWDTGAGRFGSGMYIYRMAATSVDGQKKFVESRRMMLTK